MMLSPVQHGQRSHRCIGQGVTQLDTLCEGSHSSSPVLREQLVFQNQGLVKGGENSHTVYSWRQTRGLQFGKKKKKSCSTATKDLSLDLKQYLKHSKNSSGQKSGAGKGRNVS